MIKDLIKVAAELDEAGFIKEADQIDTIIIKIANKKEKKKKIRRIVVTEVPSEVLDDVMEVGLLSGKALLKRPDLLRKARPDEKERTAWIKSRKKSIEAGEAYYKGPNAYIKMPPPNLRLSKEHPSRKHDNVRFEVDLDALIEEVPETKIYGMELFPFPVSEENWNAMTKKEQDLLVKSLSKSRERFLSLPELDDLLSKDAEQIWSHYDHTSRLYAGDVPHIAIVTPSGIIPPKFLKRIQKK